MFTIFIDLKAPYDLRFSSYFIFPNHFIPLNSCSYRLHIQPYVFVFSVLMHISLELNAPGMLRFHKTPGFLAITFSRIFLFSQILYSILQFVFLYSDVYFPRGLNAPRKNTSLFQVCLPFGG